MAHWGNYLLIAGMQCNCEPGTRFDNDGGGWNRDLNMVVFMFLNRCWLYLVHYGSIGSRFVRQDAARQAELASGKGHSRFVMIATEDELLVF